MNELWRMGASELVRAIRARTVSSRDVVDAHLARIEAVNGRVNAVTRVLAEEARAAAGAADRAIAADEPVGPLCGVPISVKENIDLAGAATTNGVPAFRDAVAKRDAPHIAALRAAGAIPIGRTNMPEFGMRWHTDNALHGATLNPWDPGLTPGGSSGGDAAAVASGMTPLGMGNDGAGSVRWPAQCCGVAGLKPSHGRIPTSGGGPVPFAFQLLAVHGPLARRVADLELALRAMCGPRASGDPWHSPAPFEGPPLPAPIRVLMVEDPGNLGVDPEIAAGVGRAGQRLEQAGYVVEPGDVPALDRVSANYFQTMDRFGRIADGSQPPPPGFLSADFEAFWRELGGPWAAAGGEPMEDPMSERSALYGGWSAVMRKTPLILAPIATAPPFRVRADLEPGWAEGWIRALRMVVAPNLLGLPAVAVPVAEGPGRPQVVQVIGPRFREDLCLAAARAVEAGGPQVQPIDPG